MFALKLLLFSVLFAVFEALHLHEAFGKLLVANLVDVKPNCLNFLDPHLRRAVLDDFAGILHTEGW